MLLHAIPNDRSTPDVPRQTILAFTSESCAEEQQLNVQTKSAWQKISGMMHCI